MGVECQGETGSKLIARWLGWAGLGRLAASQCWSSARVKKGECQCAAKTGGPASREQRRWGGSFLEIANAPPPTFRCLWPLRCSPLRLSCPFLVFCRGSSESTALHRCTAAQSTGETATAQPRRAALSHPPMRLARLPCSPSTAGEWVLCVCVCVCRRVGVSPRHAPPRPRLSGLAIRSPSYALHLLILESLPLQSFPFRYPSGIIVVSQGFDPSSRHPVRIRRSRHSASPPPIPHTPRSHRTPSCPALVAAPNRFDLHTPTASSDSQSIAVFDHPRNAAVAVTNNVVAIVAFSVHPQRWPSFILDTLS